MAVRAQQPEAMQSMRLDSVMVMAQRRSLLLKQSVDGSLLWDMHMMKDMPQILGNADPIHYAQMLPGVQTNNEYQGGIHVQGCDNEHNEVSIGGVPIYNVNHLLGFFSTFNASHYPSMSLTESVQGAYFPNKLGAKLVMQLPEQVPDTVSGELSVGLIASQGTIRFPISSSSALTLSLRASYINLLYGNWLKADNAQIKYSFYDVNATYINRINNKHSIIVDAYLGMDNAKMEMVDDSYKSEMRDLWGNTMGAVHWLFQPTSKWSMRNTLYTTTYSDKLQMSMVREHYQVKSSIVDVGLHNQMKWKGLTCGLEAVWHYIKPQSVEGEGSFSHVFHHEPVSNTLETSLYVNEHLTVGERVFLDMGIRGNLYKAGEGTFLSANPSAGVGYMRGDVKCSISYALRHQYLFQAGFSDMGLPSEYWFSASRDIPPQYAHCFHARGEAYLFKRRYQVALSMYYKRLYRQVESNGTLLDLINDQYEPKNLLMHGEGENYGVNVMLSKNTGRFTGWISYAYARARRTYPTEGGWRTYPANHERPHEVDVVATYALPRHWSLGMTFVACSGTPFTAPKAVYVMNGNMMSLYDVHNANRLGTYWRMDTSVNYRWKGRNRLEQGVNLSFYNLLCHNNDLFHYVSTSKEGTFRYVAVGFVSPVLPSVSYFIKL